MANTTKNLGANNRKLRRKIFRVTSTQPEYFFKYQKGLNQRKSNAKPLSIINQINFENWYIYITLKIQDNFELKTVALLDNGADQNYIKEELIRSQYYVLELKIVAPLDNGADQNYIKEELIQSQYYEKTSEQLLSANGIPLQIQYKSSNIYICHQNYYFENSFILVKNLKQNVILGIPFITQIYSFKIDQESIHIKTYYFFQIHHHKRFNSFQAN